MTDWSPSTLWWLVAGLLVAAELTTGTFYLLMLALGAAGGALAAHAGAGTTGQMAVAAVVGAGAVTFWHFWRQRNAADRTEADVQNLDIGRTVQVRHWRSDGRARVHHRGAEWDARYVGAGEPGAGVHVIRAIESSELLLDRPA